eukprot:PhM_4_TR7603/c0_g1_i1/m.44951
MSSFLPNYVHTGEISMTRENTLVPSNTLHPMSPGTRSSESSSPPLRPSPARRATAVMEMHLDPSNGTSPGGSGAPPFRNMNLYMGDFGSWVPSPMGSPQLNGTGRFHRPSVLESSVASTADESELMHSNNLGHTLGSFSVRENGGPGLPPPLTSHGTSNALRRFRHNNPSFAIENDGGGGAPGSHNGLGMLRHTPSEYGGSFCGNMNLAQSFHVLAMDQSIVIPSMSPHNNTPGGSAAPSFSRRGTLLPGMFQMEQTQRGGGSPVLGGTAVGRSNVAENPDNPDTRLMAALKASGKLNVYKDSTLTPRYRKGPKIGEGAYATVYIGLNINTDELVAIKEIVMKGPDDAKSLEEARREFELLRKLRHKHIVQYKLFEYFSHRRLARLYVEYMSGGTAQNILQTCGKLDEAVVRHIAKSVLGGLSYLHEKDILHRDIKPANILLNAKGVIKLADFGASKRIVRTENASNKDGSTYTVVGTPLYMSPETIRGESLPECDIWALGCTLYELFTNRTPWQELERQRQFGSQAELMGAILRAATNDADRERAFEMPDDEFNVSASARDFLRRCLIPSAHIRPSTKQLMSHSWIAGTDDDDDENDASGRSFIEEEMTELQGEEFVLDIAARHARGKVGSLVSEMQAAALSEEFGSMPPSPQADGSELLT